MAVSPDDRFAGLLTSSAERGGWVPGDVVTCDASGEEEPVEPRRVRLPVLIALAIAAIAVLGLAFYVFRPAETEQAPTSQPAEPEAAGASTGARAEAAADGAPPTAEVVVHVTGEVENPSVVTLTGGSRVRDAVEAAGGLTPDADAEAVNLARVLADGEQIRIPAVGESPPPPAPTGPAPDSSGGGPPGEGNDADSSQGSTAGPGESGAKIDLNTADSATLQTLPGVGPVTAEAIIAYREATPFTSIDDLLLVKGIGPKTFESLKDRVTVG
ncbi:MULTISPECIES: helix-hairpin-helix domain-containing protein [Brevibacterium]|uniref:Helix-hairpin-helix DNA-binding motif class 1 domain-containing protein n=1 Tax=Brevibacterium ammoniilyticum TaxID=1046555 RepID=A0ABP9TZR4_9MICO